MPRDWRRSPDRAIVAEAQSSTEGQQEDGGDRECGRGSWCSALTLQRNDDGTVEWVPARTPRAFCDSCSTGIGTALGALPNAWAMLRLWGLEPARSGPGVPTRPGTRLPLSTGPDALMRAIPECLLSWQERVHDIAGLSDLDRQRYRAPVRLDGEEAGSAAAVRRFLVPLKACAALLQEYRSALLGLDPGPMFRPGVDGVEIVDLDGTDAGHEILRLRYHARAYVGLATGRPEFFDGIPCKKCGTMGLERAPVPSRPSEEAYRSRCPDCSNLLTDAQHDAWVDWYATWAESAGLACRRCAAKRHAECAWPRCACRARGHTAA